MTISCHMTDNTHLSFKLGKMHKRKKDMSNPSSEDMDPPMSNLSVPFSANTDISKGIFCVTKPRGLCLTHLQLSCTQSEDVSRTDFDLPLPNLVLCTDYNEICNHTRAKPANSLF